MKRDRILIAGGGPVGLGLACALRNADVTVFEAAPRAAEPAAEFDHRVYAISPGTRGFLRDIEAWEGLPAARVAAVRRMEIHGDAGAKLAFSGRAGMPLAWIVEASRLANALEATAVESGVQVVRGARVQAAAAGAQPHVELEGGERHEGQLLVGADGPDSPMRSLLGIKFEELPYGERAVVANFETGRGHGETARQWFRKDGVLAWLPLPGNRISMVWSAPEAQAREIVALEPVALAQRVREAGNDECGELRLVSAVADFPLRSIRVPDPVAEGVALVGDAAHAVHPLAGQGVNLGFQDARMLAEELAERSSLERPGDLRVLRRYARARKEDVTAMQFVTDQLDKLFSSEAPGASWARNSGLRMVHFQPWIKGLLSDRAMR